MRDYVVTLGGHFFSCQMILRLLWRIPREPALYNANYTFISIFPAPGPRNSLKGVNFRSRPSQGKERVRPTGDTLSLSDITLFRLETPQDSNPEAYIFHMLPAEENHRKVNMALKLAPRITIHGNPLPGSRR